MRAAVRNMSLSPPQHVRENTTWGRVLPQVLRLGDAVRQFHYARPLAEIYPHVSLVAASHSGRVGRTNFVSHACETFFPFLLFACLTSGMLGIRLFDGPRGNVNCWCVISREIAAPVCTIFDWKHFKMFYRYFLAFEFIETKQPNEILHRFEMFSKIFKGIFKKKINKKYYLRNYFLIYI